MEKIKYFSLRELSDSKGGLIKRLDVNEDYIVCADGEVYRFIKTKKGYKKIEGNPRDTGYLSVTIRMKDGKRKDFNIHRLIAENFVNNPNNKPIVNHEDGNKKNNHYSNLEWVTHKENTRHAFKTGLMGIGEEHPRAKLTEEQVKEARVRYSAGESVLSLSKRYGVNWNTMDDAIKRKTWKHVK